MGPYRVRHRSPEPSSTHSLVIYLFLKDPGNRASLHVPHRVPKDTCFIPRANGLLVCSYLSEEPSPENGQNICSPSSKPHVDRRITCSGVRPGFPTRLFTHCYHCPVLCSLQHDTLHVYTLLSLPSAMQPSARYLPCLHTAITAQCHAAFSTIPSMLTWVDQSPAIQHVS